MNKAGNPFERLARVIAERTANMMQGKLVAQIEFATVKEVQFEAGTCTVQMLTDEEGVLTEEIKIIFSANMKMKPKVESLCLVAHIMNDDSEAMVVWCAEIDEVHLNGDAYGGLALTEKIAERMTRVEDELEALKLTFNTHVHSGVTTGPGSSGPTPSLTTAALTPRTNQEYIASTKVKHGKG